MEAGRNNMEQLDTGWSYGIAQWPRCTADAKVIARLSNDFWDQRFCSQSDVVVLYEAICFAWDFYGKIRSVFLDNHPICLTCSCVLKNMSKYVKYMVGVFLGKQHLAWLIAHMTTVKHHVSWLLPRRIQRSLLAQSTSAAAGLLSIVWMECYGSCSNAESFESIPYDGRSWVGVILMTMTLRRLKLHTHIPFYLS